jgi:RNA polymerase sigma-70 factor (ECF subfamily)
MNTQKLIEDCRKNKPKAQAMVYELYANKLFAVSYKYSRNRQEAEDNLHDGFMTIFNKIDQFKGTGSFEGWMKRIIINTALLTYRKDKVFHLINDEIPEEVSIEIEEENISVDDLLTLIQELPNRYRLVFNLYVLDGYSHKEIAEMLAISEGTSKSNLSRARQILKQKLEESEQKIQNNF